jgi:DNA-binding CsgD family transcriptional regulator/tetratricopeptide (TPR) repeat protein
MELLEREQFLGELEALLNDVAAGSGRLVLVSGEAGIGKTSLVERFSEEHKAQARVLWGACDALFTPRPLGPLYDIAQQAQGNLLDLLEEEAPRASIFSAALDELKRERKPSIMVVEDVHWADEATLDLLKFLGRRIGRTNSMIVVTYRDDEVGAEHPLRLVLGDLPHRSVARLRLPPLSEEAVKRLAERASRHIEDLYLVTGGNPFFVTEALQSQEGVPVTVRDAVLSRKARLSPEAREVLQLVSVVPARAERWLLDDTMSLEAAALEECISAGVLRHEGQAVAFRHELARRAVEDSLPVSLRQRLHALILKALLTLNAGPLRTADGEEAVIKTLRPRGCDALLARIVHHAAQAGDADAVLKYAPIAAKQAAALNAHRESASHYQTALEYADQLTPEERAGLFECLSYECHLTGLLREALQARRRALEIWEQLGDKRRESDNLRWMSRLSWFSGSKKEAEEYGAEAVKILEGLPPGPELAMAYSNRAQLHMLMDNGQQAVLWGTRAIELAKRLGATETLIHALNNVGSAEMLAGNEEEGRLKLEESLRLALLHNFQEHAVRDYTNLASFTVIGRNYRLAMHYLDNGIAYTTEHDIEALKLYMIALRARAHFEQGRWDSAADEASFVLGHYQLSAITKIPALAVLGHLRVRRGDPDAMRLLDEALELALETGELQRIAPVAAARAEFAWLKGDLELVMREAQLVSEMARGHDDSRLRGEFPLAFWVWRAGCAMEPGENLYAPYALQVRGDWRAAAEAWRQIGCPYEEAVALSDGDKSAQLAALEIFESLGARPMAERLQQALRQKGVRGLPRGPRQSTKENPAGLTNRQMEVLAAIADGLSNAEIAERLFISPKTVDHHVSAILAKLDARTRAEAVSRALQSGLINKK